MSMIYRVEVYRVLGGVPESEPVESRAYGDVFAGRSAWRIACSLYYADADGVTTTYAVDLLAALDGGETATVLDAWGDVFGPERYRVALTVQLGECSTASEEPPASTGFRFADGAADVLVLTAGDRFVVIDGDDEEG